MLAVFASFEHDIFYDRIKAGMVHVYGREALWTTTALIERNPASSGAAQASKSELARRLSISRTSVRRFRRALALKYIFRSLR